MTDTARSALLAELLAGEDPAAGYSSDTDARLEGLVDAAIAEGIRNAPACRCGAVPVHQHGCPSN